MGRRAGHYISHIEPGSICDAIGIEVGDYLVAVNEEYVEDIFDYDFLTQDDTIALHILTSDGKSLIYEIEKEPDEDLGLGFEESLMDDYRACRNKCIFCFIDQMPPGMRETLYFKDDDARLSFLQGNYITLTNLSEHDVDRLIKYHMEPINISIHTTNPELRCRMLGNRFAGVVLDKLRRFYNARIRMNAQIVLCKGINDGEELEKTIRDLAKFMPYMQSLSVVPVGLTKFRDGLCKLEPFNKEDALQVLSLIHKLQDEFYLKSSHPASNLPCTTNADFVNTNEANEEFDFDDCEPSHFVHAADEWYLLAEVDLPGEDTYDGYPQIENGVGMLRSFLEEFDEAIDEYEEAYSREISIATGVLAYPYIKDLAERLMIFAKNHTRNLKINVYPICNDFFGEKITVAGLVTGGDLLAQLKGKPLGERLLIPSNMLRSEQDKFLDDISVEDLSESLQVGVKVVISNGHEFAKAILMQ
ncbi:MAG: DUF512 domain-containing protein [Lachnospiraceae bacterium]|nr:DUF512 domain-containing protein [Lachnospiraceae bacterium]